MSGISLSRTTVLTVVLLIEVAVILFFLARWYSRRWGWRSTFGRIRRYIRATFADLVRPAIQLYRFGRNVRLIAAQLNDPGLGGVLRSATGDAEARLAAHPDNAPFAVRLTSDSVSLGMSGPQRVRPEQPWTAKESWWEAPRAVVTPGPANQPADVPIGHVVVGAENGALTLIDLLQAPGVIEVTGPDRQVGSLICAVAAQLSAGLTAFEEMDVVVAAGLHPSFTGPRPLDVLRDLDTRSRVQGYQHRFTVLLCGPLNDAEAALLTAIVPRLPLLRVMLAGVYDGRRWKLPLTETGRIEAPELGLFTDSAPVERGVARALKLRAQGGVPDRPVVQPVSPAELAPVPTTRREARQAAAGKYAPPPAAASSRAAASAPDQPLSPDQSAFFDEPEYEAPVSPQYAQASAAQGAADTGQFQQYDHRSSYSDDAYAPPNQAATTGAWSQSAGSPWDLDEPEPDSPPTGGHSVSAISAARKPAPDPDPADNNDSSRPRH